ncbi:MAG: MATE family efflux transporter [Christensenellaceae bacterium]|jgi:putative MATE family efflux protein|nr:MATE family efflux transporter [Christensenellaceae bacterium]
MLFTNADLFKLIIPLVIEQFLNLSIGMSDSTMASFVTQAAVSGISLVDSINVLLVQVFSALATGGAVISAQYLGRRDLLSARASAKQLYLCVLLASLVITLAALCFRDQIIRAVFGQLEDDVFEAAKIYLITSALSYPFLGLYNAGVALFRSMGNSRVSLFAALIMNLVNMAGNVLVVYVLHWGVFGIALFTLVARVTSAAFVTYLLLDRRNPIFLEEPFKLEFRPQVIRNILHIGIPSGFENSIFQIGKVMVASLISSFGTVGIEANAIANLFSQLQTLPGSSVSLAMLTVVGRCIGANDEKQATRYTNKLMLFAVGGIIGFSLILYPCRELFYGLFNVGGETKTLVSTLILIHTLGVVTFWPWAFTLPSALRASNDVRFCMVASIACMWIFRLGASYVFSLNTILGLPIGLGLGVAGVWLAMALDWIARAGLFVWRFKSGRWLQRKLI